MHARRDIVDIAGLAGAPGDGRPASSQGPSRPWLGVLFRCCGVYARLYRDDAGSCYRGRCPRCGSWARARIGPGGTSRRFFEAG